ncbi:MAG: hypothetical protein H0W67_05995, partial [Gemmatimonadales bacterium]|nr:hypothetical protein [Gemmatimonadales bacterium]
GLLIALGPGVDRPISAWDEAFLPMELRDRIAALRVPGADGRPVPVVKTERTMFLSTAPMPAEAPPDWTVRYLMAGLITGALLVALALLGRRSGAARGGFAALATIWAVATGIAGLVLAGLWGLTDHVMAYRNENLLQLSPLGIALALVIVPAVRGSPRWGRLTRALAAAVVALSAMGLVLKVLPAFRQVNGPIIAFALPVHLGLLGGVRILRLHGP